MVFVAGLGFGCYVSFVEAVDVKVECSEIVKKLTVVVFDRRAGFDAALETTQVRAAVLLVSFFRAARLFEEESCSLAHGNASRTRWASSSTSR